jgi:hypothetical protein
MSQAGPLRPREKSTLPWGLIGMAILVGTIEGRAIRDRPHYMGTVAASARFKGQFVHRKAPGREVLCFGDSMIQYGVLPKVIERTTGRRGYNLAVQAGPAPASYFLLRRALESGARPSTIVANFAAKFLSDRPWHPGLSYPWPDLLELDEAIELSWVMRDPDLLARVLVDRCLHSCKNRYEIRASILAALRGEPTINQEVISMLWRNWNQNDGAQAKAKTAYREAPIPHASLADEGSWTCAPSNEHYVRRFLDLAAQHRITVYWLITPLSPTTQELWHRTGNDARFARFVRSYLERYPNLVVVDARHSGFEPSVFIDGIHLDRDGAIALSTGLAEILPGGPGRPHAGPRWMELPPYREPAGDAPVEDVAKSVLVRRMLGSNARR